MERALTEACLRLELALRAVDEALTRAEQLRFGALADAVNDCATHLEWARAIAEGCFDPLANDEALLVQA